MKTYLGIAAFILSGAANAQSGSNTALAPQATSIAPSTLKFSPAIEAGARSVVKGAVKDLTKGSQEVGPYVKPSFALSYSQKPVKLNVSYELEINGNQQFGTASSNIGQTMYFKHNPVLILSTQLDNRWNAQVLIDYTYQTTTENSAENKSEIFVNPEIGYSVTSALNVSAGYVMHQTDMIDSLTNTEAGERFAKTMAAENKTAARPVAIPASILGSAKNTLHAGIATATYTISPSSKWTTFVRAGRRVQTPVDEEDSGSYRLQSEVSFATPIAALKGKFRYRMNIEDALGSKSTAWYNLARVTAEYALTDNLSATLFNETKLEQANALNSKTELENENYLGLAYSF